MLTGSGKPHLVRVLAHPRQRVVELRAPRAPQRARRRRRAQGARGSTDVCVGASEKCRHSVMTFFSMSSPAGAGSSVFSARGGQRAAAHRRETPSRPLLPGAHRARGRRARSGGGWSLPHPRPRPRPCPRPCPRSRPAPRTAGSAAAAPATPCAQPAPAPPRHRALPATSGPRPPGAGRAAPLAARGARRAGARAGPKNASSRITCCVVTMSRTRCICERDAACPISTG